MQPTRTRESHPKTLSILGIYTNHQTTPTQATKPPPPTYIYQSQVLENPQFNTKSPPPRESHVEIQSNQHSQAKTPQNSKLLETYTNHQTHLSTSYQTPPDYIISTLQVPENPQFNTKTPPTSTSHAESKPNQHPSKITQNSKLLEIYANQQSYPNASYQPPTILYQPSKYPKIHSPTPNNTTSRLSRNQPTPSNAHKWKPPTH